MEAKLSVAGGSVRSMTGDETSRVLRTRDDAERYVASVCFKHGPPRLVGVELEWLVHHTAEPAAPLDPTVLRAALGPYAPPSLDPRSPARPLPGGGTVTVEPGGQVELASPPLAPFGALVRTVAADAEHLHKRLDAHGFAVSPLAADPLRPPRRVLDLPRYRAMEHRFDRVGPWGRSGMCSTAAVQVCVDATVRTRAPKGASGGLASSTWPPGSTVTVEPPGRARAGETGSNEGGACGPRAVRSTAGSSGAVGAPAWCTSHSSSTPVSRGGPCLKQTEATYTSASSTVRSRRAAEAVARCCPERACPAPRRRGSGALGDRVSSVVTLRTLPAGTDSFAPINGRPDHGLG